MSELMKTHTQWAKRPDDERFLSLDELHSHLKNRSDRSTVHLEKNVNITSTEENPGQIEWPGKTSTPHHSTHWAFGQLCKRARVPSEFARNTHPTIASDAIGWGMQHWGSDDSSLVYCEESQWGVLVKALTSASYGRIYDHQVSEAVMRVNVDGRWKVPAASYASVNPRRATTLYASDRDVFIFMVDPERPIEVRGETLFRGFYVWNSEVGKSSFGLTTFLYRTVCDNRIIWGAEDVRELRIRHTSGAPERFGREGQRLLADYSSASPGATEARIEAAMDTKVGDSDKEVSDWLVKRRFHRKQADAVVKSAKAEEGGARTVWDLVQGGTALARSSSHTDSRLALELQASNLMLAT